MLMELFVWIESKSTWALCEHLTFQAISNLWRFSSLSTQLSFKFLTNVFIELKYEA